MHTDLMLFLVFIAIAVVLKISSARSQFYQDGEGFSRYSDQVKRNISNAIPRVIANICVIIACVFLFMYLMDEFGRPGTR